MTTGLAAGKVAAVTGAANGIGRACALALADAGADVAVLDIEGGPLREVAREIEARGCRSLAVVGDLADLATVQSSFRQVVDQLGVVEILVNNVGGGPRERSGPFADFSPAFWDQLVDVNLKSTFACTQQVIKGMIAAGGGKIVNISSDSAFLGSRAAAPYSAAKGAVVSFTRALARELAPHRINVNSVAPGYIQTRAMSKIPADLIEKAVAETPLGFLGAPEDIANAVLFFASEMSRYATGQTLLVNGGRYFH